MMRPTASAQRRTSSKEAIRISTRSGTGLSRTVTSVTTPSMPSEPVSSASSGRPGASPAVEPSVSHSPSMVATRTSSRLWTVSPCFGSARRLSFGDVAADRAGHLRGRSGA
jgi:hypothetical protein